MPVVTVGDNLVRTTTCTNIDGGMNASASISYQNSIENEPRELKYNISLGSNYNKSVGFLNAVKYNSERYSLPPTVQLNYSIEELLTIIPNYHFTYNASSYDISQERNRDFTNHGIGVQAFFYWPKNVVFSNDLSWNYYENVSPRFDNSSLLWSMSLGY